LRDTILLWRKKYCWMSITADHLFWRRLQSKADYCSTQIAVYFYVKLDTLSSMYCLITMFLVRIIFKYSFYECNFSADNRYIFTAWHEKFHCRSSWVEFLNNFWSQFYVPVKQKANSFSIFREFFQWSINFNSYYGMTKQGIVALILLICRLINLSQDSRTPSIPRTKVDYSREFTNTVKRILMHHNLSIQFVNVTR